jgi:general secretion pathway protein C
MEALFNKQFWAINLMFLALCAYLLARGGNQFLGWYVLQSATRAVAPPPARLPPPPKDRGDRISSVQEDGNMFGARVEAPEALNVNAAEEAKKAEEQKKAISDGAPVPTTLRLKLAGITWFEEAEFSLASITDQTANETALYSINRCPRLAPDEEFNPQRTPCNKLLKDNTILRIEPERVVFENAAAGRREYISLSEEPPPTPGAAPTSAPPAPVAAADAPAEGPELGKGIVKLSDNQYKIPQGDIDEVMANMNAVATQARIVPAFENGKSNGFKLFSIKPGSVFGKIGIQNGDVISKINGYDMTSPDKALEVYAKLKDAKEINVELKRRGQNMNMNYSIQ